MNKFTKAVTAAPEGSDFVRFVDSEQGTVAYAMKGMTGWLCIAENLWPEAADLLAAGIAARKASLFDYTTGQFLSGTVAQMVA
jgi:hypothetical protein